MRGVLAALDTGSRAAALMLGGVTLGLAGVVMATSWTTGDVATWAQRVFGATFIALCTGLIFTSIFCWLRLRQTGVKVWLEAGLQSATGVATLALTYTLLGISLGVGSLATQELAPETVRVVIRELTENFSLAFLTTVVGLPVSAILRTLLLVTNAKIQTQQRAPVHEFQDVGA
ncbi:MAG: hypothetical protein IH626_02345 [Rhodospirillales bacterium]|nr:hypothetical protein [Rhodospirillales bacterium]